MICDAENSISTEERGKLHQRLQQTTQYIAISLEFVWQRSMEAHSEKLIWTIQQTLITYFITQISRGNVRENICLAYHFQNYVNETKKINI